MVAIAIVVGIVAAAGGVVAGRQLRAHPPKPKPRPSGGFIVTSSYQSRNPAEQAPMSIRTGATADAPGWGAVLFTEYDQYTGSGKRRRIAAGSPVLLVSPDRTGRLRIVDHSLRSASFLLRSSRGWLYSLTWESNLTVPTLYELGRKLNPARLPPITRGGFAVPMTYVKNDRTHSAVVLVGINDTGGIISPSTLYGYLDGYALPKPTSLFAPLKRPLLGPDRATYGIDVAARRLVRVSAPLPGRRAWDPFDSLPAKGCSSWPGAHATYLACPTSVIRIARDGSRALVFEDRNCDSFCRSQGD
jgi:hypothetical protein